MVGKEGLERRVRKKGKERLERLHVNHGPATDQLCDKGQVMLIPELQFPLV